MDAARGQGFGPEAQPRVGGIHHHRWSGGSNQVLRELGSKPISRPPETGIQKIIGDRQLNFLLLEILLGDMMNHFSTNCIKRQNSYQWDLFTEIFKLPMYIELLTTARKLLYTGCSLIIVFFFRRY